MLELQVKCKKMDQEKCIWHWNNFSCNLLHVTFTCWQLICLFDTTDRTWNHVYMLSLLAQILLEVLHKVQRVRLFLAHWINVMANPGRRKSSNSALKKKKKKIGAGKFLKRAQYQCETEYWSSRKQHLKNCLLKFVNNLKKNSPKNN